MYRICAPLKTVLLLGLSSALFSCVTEPIEQPKPAYSYTVINENNGEPFADSPCIKKPEYGFSRIGIGFEGTNSIFVCSGAPLRKLAPYKYAADPGFPMAVAIKEEPESAFPVMRSADENAAYVLDYSLQSGLRIFYPLAREGVTSSNPVYLNLVGQNIECEGERCALSRQWVCVAKKEDLEKYTAFVKSQPDSSIFKKMNQANLAKAKELGCFN